MANHNDIMNLYSSHGALPEQEFEQKTSQTTFKVKPTGKMCYHHKHKWQELATREKIMDLHSSYNALSLKDDTRQHPTCQVDNQNPAGHQNEGSTQQLSIPSGTSDLFHKLSQQQPPRSHKDKLKTTLPINYDGKHPLIRQYNLKTFPLLHKDISRQKSSQCNQKSKFVHNVNRWKSLSYKDKLKPSSSVTEDVGLGQISSLHWNVNQSVPLTEDKKQQFVVHQDSVAPTPATTKPKRPSKWTIPLQTKTKNRVTALTLIRSRRAHKDKQTAAKKRNAGELIQNLGLWATHKVKGAARNIREGFKPLEKFQQAARSVLTLIKATKYTSHQREDPKLLSFTQYKNDILGTKASTYGDGLVFDPMEYRSHKQSPLSQEAKTILGMDPSERTPDQLHTALLAMQTAVEAFSEFPINMQNSLIRVGWYEQFGPRRVIIRQGHTADNFYFIVSGTAVVTLLETNKKTGEAYSRTLALLGAGNSFGELALMHAAKRSATVTVQDEVGLLAVSRDDFVDIFMHAEKDKEPEHIVYLKNHELIKGWPVERLPRTDPNICLFTYFRRGTVMVQDSNKCDWIYFIKSGSCRVLKSLPVPSPVVEEDKPQIKEKHDILTPLNQSAKSAPVRKQRLCHHGSAPPTVNRSVTLYGFRNTAKDDQHLMNEHRRQLDVVYRQKHDEAWKHQQLMEAQKRKQVTSKLFVEIQQLGVHDTFGLDHVAFSILGNCPSVSLVSDGAEAVLINKRFFLQHLSDDVARILRTTIRPYPDEESLQQKLRLKTTWDAFKHNTVNDHVTFSRLLRQTNSMYF